MTVSSTTNRVSYAGNGSTTVFSFPYYFLAASDLLVTLTDASGNISTKVLTTDYTVSGTLTNGVFASGGNVTMVVAPAAGLTLSIIRVPSQTQGTHWVDNDPDPAAVKETAFDKLTVLVQRAFDLLSRAPTLPDGFTTAFNNTLPTVLPANYTLVVNPTGNGWVVAPSASSGTVTSVGLALPAELTVSSSPVTSAGILTAVWASAIANKVFASPNGAPGTPSFRSLVAADLPAVPLTTGVTGVLPVANGGTNSGTTLTNSKVMVSVGGAIVESAVTTTTLAFLDATSSVQTQLNGKQAAGNYITGTTGDVVATGPGSVTATIQAGAVTLAKQANLAANSIQGNNTGSPATPIALTATQATAMLNAFVGDSGSGGTKGLVLAPAAGDAAAGKFLKADGTWATTPNSGNPTVVQKSSAYTVLATDGIVVGDASGAAFTLTLPAASGNSGKTLRFKKKDSTFNAITIARAGSDTIDGGTATSTTLNTQNEYIELISDGTSIWYIQVRDYPRGWISYTPTFSAGWGIVTNIFCYYRRSGDSVELKGFFTTGTVAASAGRLSIPTGLTINNPGTGVRVGTMAISDSTTAGFQNSITMFHTSAATTNISISNLAANASANNLAEMNPSDITGSATSTAFNTHPIPITGWN